MKLFTRNIKAHDNTVTRDDKVPDLIKAGTDNVFETSFLEKRLFEVIDDKPRNRINPKTPITIEDQDTTPATPITSDMLRDAWTDWSYRDSSDVTLEPELRELIIHTSTNLPANDEILLRQFGLMTLEKENLPAPSPSIIYQFTADIQNQAVDFLSSNSDSNYYKLLAGITGTFIQKPINRQGLIVAVKNHDHFVQLVDEALNVANTNNLVLGTDLNDIRQDLNNTNLTDMDAYHLNEDSEAILALLNAFNKDTDVIVAPTNIRQLLHPSTFIILNLDELTYDTESEFNNHVKTLSKNIEKELIATQYTSINKIRRASAFSPNKASSPGYQRTSSQIHQNIGGHIKATTSPATGKNQLKAIENLIKKRVSSIRSENMIKVQKATYQRASRRDPDDMNLKGKIRKTLYNPDVHIFLDSSGSISEDMYSQGIYAIILIAQRLKSDLYFSSFSHVLAEPVKIRVAGKSAMQIYKQIIALPKVSGGTNYTNVYRAIDEIEDFNTKHSRASRLNFMMTDFEYDIEDSFQFVPSHASVKNTFYMGLDVGDNQRLNSVCQNFQQQAINANNKHIANHIL